MTTEKGGGEDVAGSKIKKSSSICHTNEMRHSLRRIHSIVSDNKLNKKGALLIRERRTLS